MKRLHSKLAGSVWKGCACDDPLGDCDACRYIVLSADAQDVSICWVCPCHKGMKQAFTSWACRNHKRLF